MFIYLEDQYRRRAAIQLRVEWRRISMVKWDEIKKTVHLMSLGLMMVWDLYLVLVYGHDAVSRNGPAMSRWC